MADSNSTSRSEDVLGQKWDRCVSDSLAKIGGGLGLGVIFSVFIFKRRPWPIAFGAGIGLGMGYANCQHDFKDPFNLHGKIVKIVPEAVAEKAAEVADKAAEVTVTPKAEASST